MKTFDQLMANFAALQLRERIIAVAVGATLVVLVGNLVLLKPIQTEIDRLRALDNAHRRDLDVAMKELANVDGILSTGADPLAILRAERDEFLRQIAEADAFYAQKGSQKADIPSLASNVLQESPGVVLISLRTLPAEVFYAPPKAVEANVAEKVVGDISKLLTAKAASTPVPSTPAAFQKTLYKHAIEVSVKGNYTELVSYMEKLQKYPKRVFWSEARLNATAYPVATLRLSIFVISDSPTAALD